MEARTILFISMVLALWTSTTMGEFNCSGLDDGPYCEHCWNPVQCTGEAPINYGPCGNGMACTVAFGSSYCTSHTETECACSGVGDQCDAYNPKYIEHCDAGGPFLVEECPTKGGLTCFNDECGAFPTCNLNSWTLTPDCTEAFYCDSTGIIKGEVSCEDGNYVNSEIECSPLPVPACDGSCSGRCPNPVDCTKFFICEGTTAMASGDCPAGTHFDIVSNNCLGANATCTFLDKCDLDVGISTSGPESSTTTAEIIIDTTTTTTDEITTTPIIDTTTTTTDEITSTSGGTTTTTTTDETSTTTDVCCTAPPDGTCNSSSVGGRFPSASCSQQYYVCAELVGGAYDYIVATCLGDYLFSVDPTYPYCTEDKDLAGC